jgi:hypothetical protein
MVFFLKNYSDSQCCWKKYSDFGGGKKKKSDSEFLSYNLMLNSGKKFRALRDKKINILTFVLSEKKILNETKNHNPLLQVKWSVPYWWWHTYCTSIHVIIHAKYKKLNHIKTRLRNIENWLIVGWYQKYLPTICKDASKFSPELGHYITKRTEKSTTNI